jgi:D-psicose/D-tagatose/L-ribulose 3-epimerase
MNYGIHGLLFTETFTRDDLWILDKAKELGYDGLEITLFDPDLLPADEIGKRSESLGLRLNTGIGLDDEHNLISPDAETRKRGVEFMKRLVEVSAKIGAENLTGVNYAGWGYLTGRMRTDREWEWAVEAYREICGFASETTDVMMCVEPVNRFESHFINIAEDAVRFLEDVGAENSRVHLDTFHMVREEDSFARTVKTCGKKLGYVHACENQRGIPGTGLVPWEEFYKALAELGYDGWITVESFDPNMENIAKLCCIWRRFADSPEELASKGLEFLKGVESQTNAPSTL